MVFNRAGVTGQTPAKTAIRVKGQFRLSATDSARFVQMSLDVVETKAHGFADFVIRDEASLHPIVNCPGLNVTIVSTFSFRKKTLPPSFFRWLSFHFVFARFWSGCHAHGKSSS
jgi:hypothetical protein